MPSFLVTHKRTEHPIICIVQVAKGVMQQGTGRPKSPLALKPLGSQLYIDNVLSEVTVRLADSQGSALQKLQAFDCLLTIRVFLLSSCHTPAEGDLLELDPGSTGGVLTGGR